MEPQSNNRAEKVKFWRDPRLDNLDLMRATFITHAFPRHFHEEYAIGMIERGSYTFYYRGNMEKVSAGEVVLINPGEVHTGQALQDSGWTYRVLYPGVTLMRQIAVEMTGKQWQMPYFPHGVIDDPITAMNIRKLHMSLESADTLLEQDTLLRVAFGGLILRHATNKPLSLKRSHERGAVRRVREYLEAHYTENPTLEDLAALVSLSPYHLLRVFRDEVGLPPHKYLTQLRVQQARALLAAGLPITEVALATGFTDQSHLSKRFKQVIGVTPGKYAIYG